MGILKTCKVIQALAENGGKLTVTQIDEIVDVPKKEVMYILRRLIQQGRVSRDKLSGSKKYRYWFDETTNFESDRGKDFKTIHDVLRSSTNLKIKKTTGKRPLWQRVVKGEEKIALLQRVYESSLSKQDKELIASIISDYGVIPELEKPSE